MSRPKQMYDERKEQQHQTEMARLKMQQEHYDEEAEAKKLAKLALGAVSAFLTGKAWFKVTPSAAQPGTNTVEFEWPGRPKDEAS